MEYIGIGVIIKPQGIKGEVKVKPHTDDMILFEKLEHVYIEKKGVYTLKSVLSCRVDNEYVYLALEDVKDRNAAEELRNAAICLKKEELNLPEHTYYISDLIGMRVEDEKGGNMGILDHVIETGAVDVYVVKSAVTGFMFPALKRVILSVDSVNKLMTLDAQKLSEVAVYEV